MYISPPRTRESSLRYVFLDYETTTYRQHSLPLYIAVPHPPHPARDIRFSDQRSQRKKNNAPPANHRRGETLLPNRASPPPNGPGPAPDADLDARQCLLRRPAPPARCRRRPLEARTGGEAAREEGVRAAGGEARGGADREAVLGGRGAPDGGGGGRWGWEGGRSKYGSSQAL